MGENAADIWRFDDNSADNVVSGRLRNGELIGATTADVHGTVGSSSAFHLNGSTQYVRVNLMAPMRPDEYAALWIKYASNPVLVDPGNSIQFGQVVAKPGGGWWFYGCYHFAVYRWYSTDLITWTDETLVMAGGGVGAWDAEIHVVMPFQLPDNSWMMLYRGNGGGGLQVGQATSADGTTWTRRNNGGTDDGLFARFDANYDPTCVMLVGSTYYIYINGDPDHGHTNLYTSTDLDTFTPYAGNPIFDNAFCGTVWKHGDYYYMLIPRDTAASGSTLYHHGLALYRCANPIFDRADREYLGYPVINDKTYDDGYLDTPSLPMTDIYRTTYAPEFGNNLHFIYSGDLSGIKQALVSTTISELEARPVIPEAESETYHRRKRTFSLWLQGDAFTDYGKIFSVGSTPTDAAPVQLVVTRGGANGLSIYLYAGYHITTASLVVNTPYHVVVVDDFDLTSVYVNGAFVTSYALENINTDANYLYANLDGYVWDFRIYPSALTGTEIINLYNTGSIDKPI